MLDSIVRPIAEPSLGKIADQIAKYNIHASIITLAGLIIGLIGCFAGAIQAYMGALLLIVASRLVAGIGRTIARRDGETDFGNFLHIVCDLIFYGAFVFFFILGHPEHVLAGSFLLFSYVAAGASLLAYGMIAAQNGLEPNVNEDKSFFHPASLAGSTETLLFMIVVCLMPGYFSFFAFVFGLVCWVSTVGRAYEAWRVFSPIEQNYDDAENIR